MQYAFAMQNSVTFGYASDALRIGARMAHLTLLLPIFVKNRYSTESETGLGQLLRKKQLFHLADITSLPTYGEQATEATIKLPAREV